MIKDTFGQRVRDLRIAKGYLTQLSFLQAINLAGANLSQGRLSELETGDGIPNGETVAKIADVLDTSADFLLMRTNDASPVVTYEAIH